MEKKQSDGFIEKIKEFENAGVELSRECANRIYGDITDLKHFWEGKKTKKYYSPEYETPSSVIYREGGMRILKYTDNPEYENPVLIIPSLINKYYILDLMEEASFVKFLSDLKVPVYVLDWGETDFSHNNLSLNHYIFKWINRAVKKVLRDNNSRSLCLMGYCMGATLASIYASKKQDKVNSFISLAAPYDFTGEDPLSIMARSIDVEKLTSISNQMSADMMQSGILMAQPASIYHKLKSLYSNGGNKKRNKTFFYLERWLNDNVDFPVTAYKDYIQEFYHKNSLAQDKLQLDGKKISLSNLKVPVLNVIARRDGIVPEKSAKFLNEKIKSEKKEILEIDAGHIGIIMGSKAKKAWESMFRWYKGV
ncbi:MAG: alpha/beta fold hydrolase [Candidatus Muiribacteriota bacterium]